MQTKAYSSSCLLSFFLITFLFLFLHLNVCYAQRKFRTRIYKPLFLNCGSPNNETDIDGRKWEADLKFIASGDRSNVRNAEQHDPSIPSGEPYLTARMFTSQTTYKFPIADDTRRILLRLHFYPSPYPHFKIENSYFSVTAGHVTLLNNFSAHITAQALSQSYIMKEYFLAPSNVATLDVTFTPAENRNSSFAFVNAIELFQSPVIFDEGPTEIGRSTDDSSPQTLPIGTNSLETMYRLNVGGQYIAPANDSGNMSRSWYDDTHYLLGGTAGVLPTPNVTIEYKEMAPQIAPLDVYKTARSMGADSAINKDLNLTWLFRVDANFSYIVRFHWCDWEAFRSNQRVFNIYINNQTAQKGMDLYAWTKTTATPTKKDFWVRVTDRPGDEEIRVQLQPALSEKPEWGDVLLNGLEIFKISDQKSNLAAPNPTQSDILMKLHLKDDEKAFALNKKFTPEIIGGAAGGFAAFGLAAALVVVAYNRKKKPPKTDISGTTTSWLPVYGSTHSSSSGSKSSSVSGKASHTHISSDAASNCRYFSLADIRKATNNFDESYIIGVGGFGKVYRGIMDDDTKVAVKRSHPSSEQGVHEFQTEIEMLSKLRHRHLVSLIGFCEEENEMVLVYDYMGHGTLREHLYKGNENILTWKQRLEICIGAARGLHYLHTGAKYTIIHRDVKTTNILLDDNWVAKVSDFGLSKTGPDMNQGHISTVVKGSFGYLDPEYFRRQQLTEKSDVYSFGVVLFEALCARPALNTNLSKEQVSLSDWALQCHRKGCIEDIIDPNLKGKIRPECLKKFAETAVKCLSDHGVDRPSMGDVLWNLEYALQLQDNNNVEANNHHNHHQHQHHQSMSAFENEQRIAALHRTILSPRGDEDASFTDTTNNNDIFSQIVNQKGR